MPMNIRAFRIPDRLWFDALRTAEARGETLSQVIRRSLTRYVARHRDAEDAESEAVAALHSAYVKGWTK